ncbi:PAS domain S-box protein [candidate division KSB1 bacterium]|nr:PAS domain S-box protein [candidate division KSB1 bacterium]
MKRHVATLISLFGFFFFTATATQSAELAFEHLSLKDGLSQSSVLCTLQDRLGFLWFGTEDGLNKYDGYHFTVYKRSTSDPNSIIGNNIRVLYEDSRGKIWIGTEQRGLNCFDPVTEQFTAFRHDPNDSTSLINDCIRAICEFSPNTMLIGTDHGLDILSLPTSTPSFYGYGTAKSTPKFVHILHDSSFENSLSDNHITAIFRSRTKDIYIATWGGGINKLKHPELLQAKINMAIHSAEARLEFEHLKRKSGRRSLNSNYIYTLYEDIEGIIWIGTYAGLNKIDPGKTIPVSITNVVGQVFSIAENDPDELLISIWGAGLLQYNRYDGSLKFSMNVPYNSNSLTSNFIYSILRDNSGIFWFGTMNGGINKFDSKKNRFAHYSHLPENPNSLSHNNVTAFVEDNEGYIWIGTYEGLNRFDQSTHNFKHYKRSNQAGKQMSSDYISALLTDASGNLWIGTRSGGLLMLDKKRKRFKSYRTDSDDPQSISNNSITSLVADRSGQIWIGTLNGLNCFDPTTEIFTHYKPNPQNRQRTLSDREINCLSLDKDGILWIGTRYGGLNAFDPLSNYFISYQNSSDNPFSISSDCILCVVEDRSGNIWIGTDYGLNLFENRERINFQNPNFKHYTELNGLPNHIINGIIEDEMGRLWISSNAGITKFDVARNICSTYELNDGLQSFEFNPGAYYKSNTTGDFYFGGINGFNQFHPDQVRANHHVPPVVLTAFKIFDQPAKLDTSISFVKKIQLNYNQNFFSFEFSALDFSNPGNNQYAYKLEGFDHDWINCGSRRYVSYTNLPPKSYRLNIIASNNDHIWNEKGIRVNISIVPPFWKQLWFRILLLVMLPSVFIGMHQWRVYNIDVHRRRLENEVEHRTFELRQKTDELERKEKLYRNLVETSPDAIVLIDTRGDILMLNRRAAQLSGTAPSVPIIGTSSLNFIHPSERDKVLRVLEIFHRKRNIRNVETRILRADGTTFPAELGASLISDAQGTPKAIIIVLRDVTERKRVEGKINASLREKEVLLKEIHHRVKNNLQLVSSLLNLQSASIKDPETLEKFRDSQHRVRSMAMIHEKLYQTEDLSNIDFKAYIQNLVNSLFRSFGINSALVELNIDVEKVHLGVDIAIPCGLIINELVSNALKHGFPEIHSANRLRIERVPSKPTLTIRLKTFQPDLIKLVVADNGSGFPPDFDLQKSESLGLQLVMTLVEQLNGSIDLRKKNGTAYSIQFSR